MKIRDLKRDYAQINMRHLGSELLRNPELNQSKIKKVENPTTTDLNFHEMYMEEINKLS